MNLSGNTILITGGTSGIGQALAEELHRRGNRVIIAGRRRQRLDEIISAHPGMSSLQLDVDNPAAIAAAAAGVARDYPDLNMLINNAGITRNEDLTIDQPDVSVSRSIIETNVISVLDLTAALLPTLKRQPTSTILTTSSGLAFVPRSNYPTYCASKAFLHSWLQSLRYQLRDTPVEVLELIPPYVQTELAGPQQAADPLAMPLAEYVAEVMALLENRDTPDGEILVERVKALRLAERTGTYAEKYALLNPA